MLTISTCVMALFLLTGAPAQLEGAVHRRIVESLPAEGAGAPQSLVIRARPMSIDRATLSGAAMGDRVVLNLFDDVSLVGVVGRTGPSSLSGTLEGRPGTFTIVLGRGRVSGIMQTAEATFRIRGGAEGHVLAEQLDVTRFPDCANLDDDLLGKGRGLPEGGASAGCDDGSAIDVLVVYTPMARTDAGGAAAIQAEIDLAVALSNDAYANSGVGTQLNLVHVAEIAYDEDGSYFDHLYRLTNPGDGYMDGVHVLRDNHSADMVALIVADNQYCGVAYLMDAGVVGPQFAQWAFSVTTWSCAAGNLTFPHELGHNMGCHHNREDACSSDSCHNQCCAGNPAMEQSQGAFEYSYGYRFYGNSGSLWRTVMAYSPGTRIPYFSNATVVFDGQPAGIPIGRADAADNAMTINQTAPIIAQFRCSSSPCETDANGDGVTNTQDLVIVVLAWGTAGPAGDVNDDGTVNVLDLVDTILNWGECA